MAESAVGHYASHHDEKTRDLSNRIPLPPKKDFANENTILKRKLEIAQICLAWIACECELGSCKPKQILRAAETCLEEIAR